MRTKTDWLLDPDTFTTSVLAILKDEYGDEFMEWDPATIEIELRALGVKEMPEHLANKINAGTALFTSNLFFVSLETFIATTLVLNNIPVTTESMLLPDIDDILWAATEVRLLLGKDYPENEYGHDIARLTGKLLADDGIYTPPQLLEFAEYPENEIANMESYGKGLEGTPAAIDAQVQFDQMRENASNLELQANKKLQELLSQLLELPLATKNDEFFQQLRG